MVRVCLRLRQLQQQHHLQRQRERPLKSFEWPTYSPTSPCEGPNPENCGCQQVNQEDYRGTISKTISGRTCQNWADDTPHYSLYNPEWHPEDGLDANYCRNPNRWGYDRAWCYTTDPDVEWEYCDVPFCPLYPTISPAPFSPSTWPSVSPTYTGGCMNLSIAVLFPAKTFIGLRLNLRVNTTTSDGNEIMWEIPYGINSYYDYGIDTKSSSIVVEQAEPIRSFLGSCHPVNRFCRQGPFLHKLGPRSWS